MVEIGRGEDRRQRIVGLQQQIWRQEQNRGASAASGVRSLGCSALDAVLPDGGVRRGSLIEWVGALPANGAGSLSLLAGRWVCAERSLVVVDARQAVSPLALATLGFDLARLVLVRPGSAREAWWACEEALRCPAVGLVWASFEQLPTTAFRRLQLAAQSSAGVGFLFRQAAALREPSWADARLLVEALASGQRASRLRVNFVRGHGRPRRCSVDVQLDLGKGTYDELLAADHSQPSFGADRRAGLGVMASRVAHTTARRAATGT